MTAGSINIINSINSSMFCFSLFNISFNHGTLFSLSPCSFMSSGWNNTSTLMGIYCLSIDNEILLLPCSIFKKNAHMFLCFPFSFSLVQEDLSKTFRSYPCFRYPQGGIVVQFHLCTCSNFLVFLCLHPHLHLLWPFLKAVMLLKTL